MAYRDGINSNKATVMKFDGSAWTTVGGVEEAEAVEGWGASLSPAEFNVWSCRQANRPRTAPYLLLVVKV